jgi:hypothetical protein
MRTLLGLMAGTLALALGGAALALAHPEPGDIDGDRVPDGQDNCPTVYNPLQENDDGDAQGNRCDPDWDPDGDGVPTGFPTRVDNCPFLANADQQDLNANGVGDACEQDGDGDTIYDFQDNCPTVSNRFQSNLDGDAEGDACDADVDGDDPDTAADLSNGLDNCPTVFNPDQRDDDRDGKRALCDADDVARGTVTGPARPQPGTTDRLAPTLRVRIARTQRLAESGGVLVVSVRCSEACTASARLTVAAARARALRLPRGGLLGSGTAQLGDAGSTYAFVRLTRAARRALARQRRVAATLRVVARDRAGNARTVARRLELRR